MPLCSHNRKLLQRGDPRHDRGVKLAIHPLVGGAFQAAPVQVAEPEENGGQALQEEVVAEGGSKAKRLVEADVQGQNKSTADLPQCALRCQLAPDREDLSTNASMAHKKMQRVCNGARKE